MHERSRWTPPRVVALPALLGLFAACSIVDPGAGGRREDLAHARARWEARGPDAYTTIVRRRCFCGHEALGPVRVTVTAVGVSRMDEVTGEPVTGERAGWFPTVEQAFGLIEEAIREDAHRLDVRYDPATGAPLDVYVDRSAHVVDEEIRYELTAPERVSTD